MGLKFIYTDSKWNQVGYLDSCKLDVEIGKYRLATNDFEITINQKHWDKSFNKGSLFYAEDTEYGGIVECKKVDTKTNNITLVGKTFRGILEKEFIQPPDGQTHLILKGSAEQCIKELIGNRFGDLVVVDQSNITVDYQIRDMNLLDALERMLNFQNAKLSIYFKNDKVHLKAVPIKDLSEQIQIDDSYHLTMNVEESKNTYNHVLALGNGELLERIRINLYRQSDGTWSDTEHYSGFDRKTFLFEDPNAMDQEELKQRAIEKCEAENGSDSIRVGFESDTAELFDVVGAREEITGISFKDKITKKILKGSIKNFDANVRIEHKVGEN